MKKFWGQKTTFSPHNENDRRKTALARRLPTHRQTLRPRTQRHQNENHQDQVVKSLFPTVSCKGSHQKAICCHR